MTLDNKREQIWQSLGDSEYRQQFVEEEINVGIAFQIRSLRNRQNLRQADLADRLNVKQPLVSSWENPNYGKYTLATLKDLAKAFDVGLLVRFVSFSTLVDWTTDLKLDNIAPPDFSREVSRIALWASLDKILDANQYPSASGPDANLANKGVKSEVSTNA